MRGYKIATHVERHGNDIDGFGYTVLLRKVLVILDIPDGVKRTTPEMRYGKAPLGLTNDEFNEWASEAQRYKEYADVHKLFLDFKDCMDKRAAGVDGVYASHKLHACSSNIHVRKCRAAKAIVVGIIDLTDGTYYDRADSDYDAHTIYQSGETVIPDEYTDDYLNICAHGIHYFESPELAWLYYVKDLPPSDASAFLNHAEELLEKLRKEGDI